MVQGGGQPWRRRAARAAVALVVAASVIGLVLVTGSALEDAQAGAKAGQAPAPVARAVLDDVAAGGTADFWVVLDRQADLSGAEAIDDWGERGRFVYDRLVDTARKTQADLLADLAAASPDAKVESFWIANAVLVRGGNRAALERARAAPAAREIVAHVTYELPDPAPAPDASGPSTAAVEWGLASIGTDRVWSHFGVRGEGIVVGNIDTGVQFDHPALLRSYRGSLDGGDVEHAYNWWDPISGCRAPCDDNGHGTHTMGTMVGDDGAGNQIGAAPGARWIAARGCSTNGCPTGALLSAGQFMLAPTEPGGGNPRPELRPHVVNNSWGAPSFAAESEFYAEMIEAWEAAGIFGAFANGNEGDDIPGEPCDTTGSPADNPTAWGVGAYGADGAIGAFSSRGPGGEGELKPNIAAPGVAVRSSIPGNQYASFSGTSMATPHQSGAVALLWAAAPALLGDLDSTRQVLEATAVDVDDVSCGGTIEDNNVWGEGRLDAFAAVEQAPRGPTGALRGTVSDAATGAPVADAAVTATAEGARRSARTDDDGSYRFAALLVGDYDVTATAFGYRPRSGTADIVDGGETVTDLALDPVPSHPVTGTVTDAAGTPVEGVEVVVRDTPIAPEATGPEGRFEFRAVPEGTYVLTLSGLGCAGGALADLVVDGSETLEVALPERRDVHGHTCRVERPKWIEATEPLTFPHNDQSSAEVELPFPFPFYERAHRRAWVSVNGFVTFIGHYASWNTSLPDLGRPNGTVQAFGDDLFVHDDSEVLVATVGDPGNRRFVIEWRNVGQGGQASPRRIDVEAVLHENGEIVVQYRNLDPGSREERGAAATVGIENHDGTDAVEFSEHQPILADERAIRFDPPAFGLVAGTVVDANDRQPVERAAVTARLGSLTRTATADDEGGYGIPLRPGTWTVEVTKPNYATESRTIEVTGDGRQIVHDVVLRTGIATVDHPEIEAIVPAASRRTLRFRLTNTGTAALDWDAGTTDAPRGAPGDTLASWPVTDQQLAFGVGYAAGRVWVNDPLEPSTNKEYTTGGSPTGRVHATPWAPGFPGTYPADMAFDTRRGWMCQATANESTGLHCWDPATGQERATIPPTEWGETNAAGVAYDPRSDTFLVAGSVFFDAQWRRYVFRVAGLSHAAPGQTLGRCEIEPPTNGRMSGLAYNASVDVAWVVTVSGPPEAAGAATIELVDPSDCSTLGSMDFPGDRWAASGAGAEVDEAGNLWLANFAENAIYHLESGVPGFSGTPWLDVSPAGGRLAPGRGQDVEVAVDTTGLTPGLHRARIVVAAGAGRKRWLTIPVRIVVSDYQRAIDAGASSSHLEAGGDPWVADQAFDGAWGHTGASHVVHTRRAIAGTDEDRLYQRARLGSSFAYQFDDLPDGVYDLELHFAEVQHRKPGQRVFDVFAEGRSLLNGYDIARKVGRDRPAVERFRAEVADGRLTIRFAGRRGSHPPLVSALRVTHRPDLGSVRQDASRP